MIAALLTNALAPQSVFSFFKAFGRPLLYAVCIWLIFRWDGARIAEIRADAAREKAAAVEARDNHWKGEIARANAQTEARRADAAIEAGKVSASLIEQNSALAARVAEMEKANAALPNPDACGLDRDRVRLLREQSR